MWNKLQNTDRRIIYIILAAVCIYALLRPMGLPIALSAPTTATLDVLEQVKPGDVVWFGFEYGASGVPELSPAAFVCAQMVFERGGRIVTGGVWAEGPTLAAPLVTGLAESMGKVYGVDYVHIGYKPGGVVFLEAAGADFWDAAVGVDVNQRALSTLPLMADFRKWSDANLVIIFTAGTPGDQEYIKSVGDPFKVPIINSTVSVSVPGTMPFLRSGQLVGLIMGMRGAAEMEVYNRMPGRAVAGMDAQSLAHVVIVLFIALGNIAYIASRGKGGRVQ